MGAPPEDPTAYLSMSAAARSGFQASIAMVVLPRHNIRRMPRVPAMCPDGKTDRVVRSGPDERIWSRDATSPNRLAWVCWTPLGSAVVPEV
nr:hypothetical protein CPGR_04404 [Mycolicibacter nonchromogenicus]